MTGIDFRRALRAAFRPALALFLPALLGTTTGGVAIPGNYCLPVRTDLRSRPVSFEIIALDGSHIKFDTTSHQPAVIGFFASWCGPCNEEMPAFRDVAHRYAAQGFRAILIDVGEEPPAVERFIKRYDLDFPVAVDTDATLFERTFGLHAIPSSAFYNANGVLTCLVQDGLTKKEIDNEASAAVGGWMPKP